MGPALYHLNPDIVRSVDKGIFYLAPGNGLDLLGYFHAIAAHLLDGLFEVVETYPHMIYNAVFCRRERCFSRFPISSVLLQGVLNRIDDYVDVVRSEEHTS